MGNRFVRCIKDVKDITKLSENVTEKNDIVSDVNGNIYIRKEVGFHKICDGGDGINVDEKLEEIIQDIENIEKDLNKIDLTLYAKKSDLVEYLKEDDLTLYAKKSELPDLTDYAKKSDIPDQLDLSPYAKKSDLTKYVKLIDLNNFITDTGWIDIELINNVLPYNSSLKPQYRIMNYNGSVEVSIRGEVKGIKEETTVIGVIPNIEIPYRHPVLQPTSKKTMNDVKTLTYARWAIKTVNNVTQIIMEWVSYDTSLMLETDWYPINTSIKI